MVKKICGLCIFLVLFSCKPFNQPDPNADLLRVPCHSGDCHEGGEEHINDMKLIIEMGR